MAHWLELLIELIRQLVATLGYTGIFVAHFAEGSWLPITSEIFLLFGGFLVLQGRFDFWGIVFAAAGGFALGSLVPFMILRYGGLPLLFRFGKYVNLRPRRIRRVQRWFEKFGGVAVLLTRPLPVLRNVVTLPAGLSLMNPLKFFLYTLFGFVPWATFIAYLGYRLGSHWQAITPYLQGVATVILVGLVIFGLWFGYRLWVGRRVKEGAN